jgi:hypothetical protein
LHGAVGDQASEEAERADRFPVGMPRREPVSIVTVFNDAEVRQACLDRSIEAHRHEAPDVDYVPVDNTEGQFRSAGAALNHGARQARHDYLVFVHQDVYLHSLDALEEAAGMLAEDESIAMLGASGVTAQGRFFGRIRDRVILSGDPAPRPTPVDCVDEVLFMIPRRTLSRHPLSEQPDLAWHAYAVDFGLRARGDGMRVCAVNIPITHNSLTVNVDRLDVAYDALAAKHPQAMPIVTPQGRIGGPPRFADRISAVRGLGAQRWRYQWLRETVKAHAARRAAGGNLCLLGDIRLDVDELMARLPTDTPLRVVNIDQHSDFAGEHGDAVALTRAGREIRFMSRPLDEVASEIATSVPGGPVLVTNLGLADIRSLASQVSIDRAVLGFRASIGYWMVLDIAPAAMPPAWKSRRATPLGMSALST